MRSLFLQKAVMIPMQGTHNSLSRYLCFAFYYMQQTENRVIAILVAWVLRIGVALAMLVTLTGLIRYLKAFKGVQANYRHFEAPTLFNLHDFSQRLGQGESIALMQLGVLILISTPILRVVITLIGFWIEKDLRYTLIAAVVLLIILMSFLLGTVH